MTKVKNIENKFWIIFFSLFSVVFISFLIVTAYRGKDEFAKNKLKQIKISGSYSYDGVTFNDLNDDNVMTPTSEDSIIIKGHFDQDIDTSMPIYFYLQGLRARILLNGEEILYHPEVTQECWIYIDGYDIKKTDDIVIQLESERQILVNTYFIHFIDKIYNATRFELLSELMKKNVLSIIACVVIFIMGIAMIIYRICFREMEGNDSNGLLACGIMMMIGGSTCFVDYNYITLLTSNLYMLKYIDQMSQAMIVVFITAYMKRYMVTSKARARSDAFVFIMLTLLSVYLIKLMLVPDSSTSDPMFATFMFAVVLIFTFELIELYRSEKNVANNKMMAFNSVILMVVAFIIEMVYFILTGVYFIKIYMISLLVFSVIQYYLLVTTNVENFYKARRASELENELTQNKIRMIISQIQPHFLYNAIGTIRALCTKNPTEARNALDYFAKYLRSNMDSLGEEGCITFAKELDHVKSYLYIEKLRFGDLLDIEYDIQTTDFECPPLSLQTMVENAVKHGLLAKKEGGKLKISSKETEYCYEIKIEDNGVGFDMTKPLDDKRTHIGITNTRQRIAGLCDGTLSVGSKIGVGTTITIAIPKKQGN